MQQKTRVKSILIVSGIIATMLTGTTLATPSSEALSYTCAGCHGTNGASNGPAIPSLAGLSKDYLVEAMQAYKEDEKNPTIMNRIAKGYSDKEFELMGDFFSAQKVHRITNQPYDNAKAVEGKKLHEKYCSACHSEGGTVTDDEVGLLSGNSAYFLRFALADFQDGVRDMPKKMKKQIKKMLKKDKDAFDKLIHYYSKGE
ncbi:cytochrome c class I [uncultured Candidatus Thioglobus sp.]|nr:cytochrome c class I [uncultured Candidatus Thioglobus sp.]SMN01714.1 cytochrome c class I [uncultured Candidatus Thioglobus sp.]